MKRYIKTSIASSNMDAIKKNLYLYYGVLKNESTDFFDDFDDVIYHEELDNEEHTDERLKFYYKYLPLVHKCYEIYKNIGRDQGGRTIDHTIRYAMFQMAKEVVVNFPRDWGDNSL